ncbi:hypothetical protein L0Y65_02245 [Candidatus Micrarchaeota archaeon]|nr:hypothetical protein [Candidatus Micrarchaeota archaeon]
MKKVDGKAIQGQSGGDTISRKEFLERIRTEAGMMEAVREMERESADGPRFDRFEPDSQEARDFINGIMLRIHLKEVRLRSTPFKSPTEDQVIGIIGGLSDDQIADLRPVLKELHASTENGLMKRAICKKIDL